MTDASTQDVVAAARALAPQIRAVRDRIEAESRLPRELIEAMARANLFQLYVPRALGGPETDPMTAFRAVEELGRVDGSVGWCSFVSSGIAIYSAWVPPEVGRELFGQPPDLRVAGSFRPEGEAKPVDGGYRVSGRWNYVSGEDHANWLFLNCKLVNDAGPMTTGNGLPATRMMMVPKQAGTTHPTWDTMGMRGTGSNDVVVADEFVPQERTHLLYEPSFYDGPHYDPRTVVVTTFSLLAGNALGMARGAMDAFVQLATTSATTMSPSLLRERQTVQTVVGEAEAIISGSRAYLLVALGDMWSAAQEGRELGPAVLQGRLAATHAIRESVRAIDMLFYAAGTNSIHRSQELERFFRDVHTAGQHIAGLHANFEGGGQVMMGLTPAAPGW